MPTATKRRRIALLCLLGGASSLLLLDGCAFDSSYLEAAGPTDSGFDSGIPDSGTTDAGPGCQIAGSTYAPWEENTTNSCQWCDAAADSADWTSRPAGADCGVCCQCDPAGMGTYADDWLNGWTRRVRLIADHNDVDSDLPDFPLLVRLSASSGRTGDDLTFVFDELAADANRKKIAVTTSDGTTQCYVEIERWDDAAEQAWLWVRVPALSSGADTELYLYFDSTQVDNDTYVGDPDSVPAENVWDGDFVLVTHMQDDPDDQHIRDSTSNDNDGTKGAPLNPHEVDGRIGRALRWDYVGEATEYIDVPDSSTLDMGGTFTAELWVNFERGSAPSNWARMLTKKLWWDDAEGWEIHLENGFDADLMIRGASNQPGFVNGFVPSWSAGGWHHVVVVYDGATVTAYRDGVPMGTGMISTATNTVHPLGIGRYGAIDTWHHWYGMMDEVRLSSTTRTPEWIRASYESQIDDLIGFAAEEICSLP